MSFNELEKLNKIIPVAEQFSKIIGEKKLFELNRRNASLLLDSPEERYTNLVKQKPNLINRVPQYKIALNRRQNLKSQIDHVLTQLSKF